MTEKSCNASSSNGDPPERIEKPPCDAGSPPVYDSEGLLKGTREILIRHHGEVYRLRLTRNDKLILHK